MNLPNKLTLSRIILVPFFVAALLIDFPFHTAVALAIFVVATLTDMFDGKIAEDLLPTLANLQTLLPIKFLC